MAEDFIIINTDIFNIKIKTIVDMVNPKEKQGTHKFMI